MKTKQTHHLVNFPMLLINVTDQFLSYCRHVKQLSHHTLAAYERDLTEIRIFAGNKHKLIDCDRQFLNRYLTYLFNDRKLKPATVKRRMACLKAMFRWLELEELIEENPFRKFNTPIRQPKQLPKGLTMAEIRKLIRSQLKALGVTNRDELIQARMVEIATGRKGFIQLTSLLSIELLFSTGVRVSELTSIRWSDIALSDKTITIHGKGNRERVVFIPNDQTLTLLRGYRKAAPTKLADNDSLLRTANGGPADSQYIRLLIRRAGERANLNRRITPHMFRHSAATQLLAAGTDIRFVQKLLGHQSILTTQIYTHVSDRQLKSTIQAKHPIGKALGP